MTALTIVYPLMRTHTGRAANADMIGGNQVGEQDLIAGLLVGQERGFHYTFGGLLRDSSL